MLMGAWLDLTAHCLGLGTRGAALNIRTSHRGATPPAHPQPHGLPSSPTQAWCVKPPAHGWPPHSSAW